MVAATGVLAGGVRLTVDEDGRPSSADVWDIASGEKLTRVLAVDAVGEEHGATAVTVRLAVPFEYEGPLLLTTEYRRSCGCPCPEHETRERLQVRATVPFAKITEIMHRLDGQLLPYAGDFCLSATPYDRIEAEATTAMVDGKPAICPCPPHDWHDEVT
jgi:hypothetical protein